jgi:DNA invertase Pin-like site-specific DNA recombinase
MRTIKKAIDYVRVSTEQQAKEGVSIEAQQAKIKACELHDYELQDLFVDADISDYTMNLRQKQPAIQSGSIHLFGFSTSTATAPVTA